MASMLLSVITLKWILSRIAQEEPFVRDGTQVQLVGWDRRPMRLML